MTKGAVGRLSLWLILLVSLSSCARVVVLEDPLSPEEHINLAVAYERRGELDAALEHYEAASGEMPVAHLYMGNVYFLKHEPEKAEKHYREALREDPENADAMNNLAWLYYTEGKNLEEAERLAREALRINEALRVNPEKAEIYGDTLRKIRALKTKEASPPAGK
jgi:tetratricopeptide (TPR) repeat protein